MSKACEFKLHCPANDGYPDVPGRYYECTCGQNYIDVAPAQDWDFCPFCGGAISSFETLTCKTCTHATYDPDFDSWYCEEPTGEGKYWKDNVDDANFDGCMLYEEMKSNNASLTASTSS